MHVSLTPKLEQAVKDKVTSGLYNNASEVVRESLRRMLEHERGNEWLQRDAAIGFAQLEANETTRVTSRNQLRQLAKRSKVKLDLTAAAIGDLYSTSHNPLSFDKCCEGGVEWNGERTVDSMNAKKSSIYRRSAHVLSGRICLGE